MRPSAEFLCRWIWQHLPEATQNRCYFFNSFFYKKLSERQPGLGPLTASGRCEAAKAAHERVRKWTKVGDLPVLVLQSCECCRSPEL